MKECKKCCKDSNSLDVKRGDVVRLKGDGEVYLVCRDGNKLRLHSIRGGNIWSSNALFGGGDGSRFELARVCYREVTEDEKR